MIIYGVGLENMKPKLTIIIAANNDETIIEEALKSASWVDEIIVVLADTSVDQTEQIAKRFTEKVYTSENHLGKQRNLGINKSFGEWIFILDTDERISTPLQKEIKLVLQSIKN